VAVEVFWSRLLSVVNEQQASLIRTAFSTIVRETQDLACGVFDRQGRMVAQSVTGTPGHINAMATGMRHFLEKFPPEETAEGDVFITNDPWLTVGQINDITVVTPVFRASGVVGYFANTCHAPDIGGRIISGEANEVFEEGLRIPMMRLFQRGLPNVALFDIVRANVRTPDETVGDLHAQVVCNEVGTRALITLLEEFDLDSFDHVADDILRRSETALRRAISEVPNGEYTYSADIDGFEEPITIAVTVHVTDDSVGLDFTGSSMQSRYGINVVENYTHAYASFAVKALLSPDVPHNHGSFNPVSVSAPAGSILNCEEPAAVASRHIVGHFIPGVVLGAFAKAGVIDRIVAGGADPIWITVWRGALSDEPRQFTFSQFQCGGMGARSSKDGLSNTGFPSGVAGVPTEIMESLTPLVQVKKAMATDSGGAGTFRGGLGQDSHVRNRGGQGWAVSVMADRIAHPALGLNGGHPGALAEVTDRNGNSLPTKRFLRLDADELVKLRLPGGGGFGDPAQRDVDHVKDDVVNGYVSIDAAREVYGVAIRYEGPEDDLVRLPDRFDLDLEATVRLRSGLTQSSR
jgi:N-methylhydantoinase B